MMAPSEATESGPQLTRQLGLFDSTMVMMGIVIGSGIYLTSGIMAKGLPSPGLVILAWLVGGLLTLTGALTFAELGAAMPHAGGQYVYLREAYGPLFGFLFGWIAFLVYMTGGIAGLAVAFAEYLAIYFPGLSFKSVIFTIPLPWTVYSFSFGHIVAVAMILVLTAINYRGLVFGKIVQNLFTVVKIGTLLLFIILGFTIGKGNGIDFSLVPQATDWDFSQLIVGFGLALVAVNWAFDGWNNVNFVSGEIKNPRRNLPLALITGTLSITVLYVLINMVYFYALPIGEVVGEVRIAEKSARALFGGAAAGLITGAVLISVFGATNGSILAGPRIYFAMAKDGLFFKKVAEVHPKYRTPAFAVLIQGLWSCVLALSGSFEQLYTFVVFSALAFWVAVAVAVFVIRKKRPDLQRPYKVWGYPVVPLIFIITSVCILINTFLEKPVESLAGIGFAVIGIPVYYYWRKKKS